jgi:SAM-dependent methyltransferase
MSEHLQYQSQFLKRVGEPNPSIKFFFDRYRAMPENARSVLEMGTKRWYKDKPTHHRDILAPYLMHVMTDVTEGDDVDVVADAHELSRVFHVEQFTAVWASSVWEHLHSPWVAAEEVLKVLKPGGLFFIQTHETFPIHGYPSDFFRFSREALHHLFRNASETVSCYEYPCRITPENKEIDWNHAAESWLNVCIAGVK